MTGVLRLDATLSALAQATRLDLIRTLVRAGSGGLAVAALVDALGVAQNSVSTHLQVLQRAGLVTVERAGRSAIYRADREAIDRLLKDLSDQLT